MTAIPGASQGSAFGVSFRRDSFSDHRQGCRESVFLGSRSQIVDALLERSICFSDRKFNMASIPIVREIRSETLR